MRIAVRVLSVLLIGVLIASLVTQESFAGQDGKGQSFFDLIVWVIQDYFRLHYVDTAAHPGGSVHVIDANGDDVGILIDGDSAVFDPTMGLVYGVNYWTGQVTSYPVDSYYESTDCSGLEYLLSGSRPQGIFSFCGDPAVYTCTATDSKELGSYRSCDTGECYMTLGEEPHRVCTAWTPVMSQPPSYPAPLHLEER